MGESSAKEIKTEKLPRGIFVNRELSWLEFNRRVLEEANNENNPLMERLKFEGIYFSNLDEFFMVRVGSLTDQDMLKPDKKDEKTGMTAKEQIRAIFEKVRELSAVAEKAYTVLTALLREHRIDLLDFNDLSRVDELIATQYFGDEIKPLLSPQIVDRHHPFPFFKNNEQYICVVFEKTGEHLKLGVIPVSHLPEYVTFTVDSRQKIALTADVVCYFAQKLFSKYKVAEKHIIRVTRNADIDEDEGMYDYDVDFRGVMQELLKKRKRQAIVRVQLSSHPSGDLSDYLCDKLSVKPSKLVTQHIPLDFSFTFSLFSRFQPEHPQLYYEPYRPTYPASFPTKNIISRISEKDQLLCYPFHAMKPFIDLIYEAANSPSVVSIKITLYRVANNSKVATALTYAAEKGKEVICILELRARFDEQNNIDYSKLLEDAGCTVIYGLSDYKIHSKLCLITRRVHHKISYITQIGTGNYNEKTSEVYTDLSLITADQTIGEEANRVFSALCVGELLDDVKELWVAPHCFKNRLIAEINREIARQEEAHDGYIAMKLNSIDDIEVMAKLIEASQAGVEIRLYVRGICCLCPGIENYTQNITIKSYIGRYLEHSRIFVFGRDSRQNIFIGSGDLLKRNTTRRVEIFVPIKSTAVREDVLRIMGALENDTLRGWTMRPDGSYKKPGREGPYPLDCQMYLQQYFSGGIQHELHGKEGLFRRFWRRLFQK